MKPSHIIISCVLLALAGCKGDAVQQPEERNDYPTMVIKKTDRQLTATYPATLRGRQDVEIRPQVSGKVIKVCVNEGAHVSKGQTLFVIDQVPYREALQKAKATLATAQAAEATARQNLEAARRLRSGNVVSDYEVRTAQNNYNSAVAQVAQARAEVRAAQNNLSYTEVKSPVSGYASMTTIRVGALVSASMTEPMLRVSDNAEMYAYFSLTEKQVLALTAQYGSLDKAVASLPAVKLQLNDGTTYEQSGRIDAISGMIDRETGAVSVRAVFSNKDRRLMSGGQADIIIPIERKNCIVIPQQATYDLQECVFAYKMMHGKPQSTPITVSEINNGKEYIVESGLQVGDVIISEGAGLVR